MCMYMLKLWFCYFLVMFVGRCLLVGVGLVIGRVDGMMYLFFFVFCDVCWWVGLVEWVVECVFVLGGEDCLYDVEGGIGCLEEGV